ncbi:MAG: HEAT repeat domain-containing protein [Phycisphaerales bacterium]|nr:HEAT repeat domain-containing protein [Phycisphaerales bacterium]
MSKIGSKEGMSQMKVSKLIVIVMLGTVCVPAHWTAVFAEDTETSSAPTTRSALPDSLQEVKRHRAAGASSPLKTVVGIPIFVESELLKYGLGVLTKFGKIDSGDNFELVLFGPQMHIGKKAVFVEAVQYSFKNGRTCRSDMTVNTEQGSSETYVGKRKANTVDDINATADFIAQSGKVLGERRDANSGFFWVVVPGWQAPMQCSLDKKSLIVFCNTDTVSGKTRGKVADKAVNKKVSLAIGGIPLGIGATLDDITRLGFAQLQPEHDVKVTLTGPAVAFGKKKLKISHLEYTFRPTGMHRMRAVVESGKDNSSSELIAFYKYIKGQDKWHSERTSPGKQETQINLEPEDIQVARYSLTSHKNANGDQIASRLEIAYPGKWTINLPVSAIEKQVKSGVHSGPWKRVRGQWVYKSLFDELAQAIGKPPTTVGTLIKDLASKERDKRLLTVLILGKGGSTVSRSALPALKKVASDDSDPDVRKAAKAAIKNIMGA